MKIPGVLFLLLASAIVTVCQDGSNILYLKPDDVNSSHVGRLAHFDFGTRSFASDERVRGEERPLTTIKIAAAGKRYSFTERRMDDGYNNWFKEQFLESILPDGTRLRLLQNEIVSVHKRRIRVRALFAYFDSEGNQLPGKPPFNEILDFQKSKLSEVLIKAAGK